jgi:hypothetical protein
MKTDELIERLGNDLAPVRPLAAPWKRAVVWLAGAGVYLGAVVLVAWMREGRLGSRGDASFVIQQLALTATAATAAIAAFVSVIPGVDRRVLGAPIVPGLVAMAALVWDSVADVQAMGTLGIGRETDWPCVGSLMLGGVVLWALAALMLRRGAPLSPHVSSLLAGVAALSVANVEACLTRPHAFAVTVLLWHGLTIAVVIAVLTPLGRGLFLRKPPDLGPSALQAGE